MVSALGRGSQHFHDVTHPVGDLHRPLLGLPIQAQATPQIAAYYDGGMPVSQIPAAQINDLIYAFGEPNDAGVCTPPTAAQLGHVRGTAAVAQGASGLRLIVSIGGWDAAPQYSDIALTHRVPRQIRGELHAGFSAWRRGSMGSISTGNSRCMAA